MTDAAPEEKKGYKWIWAALLVLLAFALVVVFWDPAGDPEDSAITQTTPDVQIMEPADIPTTEVEDMRNPGDDRMVTRIEDETAAEAATPADQTPPTGDIADVVE